MKKALLLAAVVGMMLGSTAVAQESVLWFDIRDNNPANPGCPAGMANILSPQRPFTNGQTGPGDLYNGGARGAGQILRLSLDCVNDFEVDATSGFTRYPNFDNDGDIKTGDLHLFMDVGGPYGTNDVISSIGIDMAISDPDPNGGTIATSSFEWDLTYFDNPAGQGNGIGSASGVVGAKAVQVPVAAGPVYDVVNTMLRPDAVNPYLVGTLHVVAGPWDNGTYGDGWPDRSKFTVKMTINELLITRVFEAGGDATEWVSFGYVGNSPELPAIDGGLEGEPAGGTADAEIHLRMKGDGDGDGYTNNADIGPFNTARLYTPYGTEPQEMVYTFDGDNDGAVNNADIGPFNDARARANTGGGC
ncbi:MAG: hypothetical protein JXQ75_09810 [Phycisphaerae bacterium]|nr:hypothetical protein [Phycisphaerae bacterium]